MPEISSRTPEGEPSHCWICGSQSLVDFSAFPTMDAPCPSCGCLLWYPDCLEKEPVAQAPENPRFIEENDWFLRFMRQFGLFVRFLLGKVPEGPRADLFLEEITDPFEIGMMERMQPEEDEGFY